MINEVRNTVLSILNKNNNGYLTPEEFNLFANQAQLEVFEGYFFSLANWKKKQNQRMSGENYADIVKEMEEVLDTFTVSSTLTHVANGKFTLPNDWYTLLKAEVVPNVTPATYTEIERVSQGKISRLLSSNLTAPNTSYPAYVVGPEPIASPVGPTANSLQVYPPAWTYNAIGADGDPVFNPSSASYQDFELPLSDAIDITIKICEYAGISIREQAVVNFEKGEEILNLKTES
jgi:hypothetical protein